MDNPHATEIPDLLFPPDMDWASLEYRALALAGPEGLDQILGAVPPFDPDLAVQLEIDAHDLGYSRGVRFRMAELAQEILDAAGYSVSPCGVHLFPRPVPCCARCGR